MSTRTHRGPSRVSGLLDHETQIRPRAQKNKPHRGKRGGTGNLHGAARNTPHVTTARLFAITVSRTTHPLLSRSLSGAALPPDPYNRAVTCHLCGLLACWPCSRRSLLGERESILTATGRLPRVTPGARSTHHSSRLWPVVCPVHSFGGSVAPREDSRNLLGHYQGGGQHSVSMTFAQESSSAAAMARAKLVTKFVTNPRRHAAEPSSNAETARCSASRSAGHCRNGPDCVRRLRADSQPSGRRFASCPATSRNGSWRSSLGAVLHTLVVTTVRRTSPWCGCPRR